MPEVEKPEKRRELFSDPSAMGEARKESMRLSEVLFPSAFEIYRQERSRLYCFYVKNAPVDCRLVQCNKGLFDR